MVNKKIKTELGDNKLATRSVALSKGWRVGCQFCKSKRAQLGKIITTLPVLFLIILILAIYIALSAGATILGQSPTTKRAASAGYISSIEPILLKEIQYKNQNMLVIDAMYLAISNPPKDPKSKSEENNKIRQALNPILLTEKNSCYLLYTIDMKNNGEIIGYSNINNIITGEFKIFAQTAELPIYINGKKTIIYTFYGKCSKVPDKNGVPTTVQNELIEVFNS